MNVKETLNPIAQTNKQLYIYMYSHVKNRHPARLMFGVALGYHKGLETRCGQILKSWGFSG